MERGKEKHLRERLPGRKRSHLSCIIEVILIQSVSKLQTVTFELEDLGLSMDKDFDLDPGQREAII